MLMYADDTTLYCNVNNNVTDDLLNYELSKICDWLGANKLALNVSKSKFMVFHTFNKHVIYPKLNINGNNIERVTNFNFLGLTIKWLNEHYSSNSSKNLDEQDPSNYSSKNTGNYSGLLGFRSSYLTDRMYERIEA